MFPITVAPMLHFLLESVGIFIAFRYYLRQRQQLADPVSDRHRFAVLIAAIAGAFLGSRLLGSLENPQLFWQGGGTLGWQYYLQSKTILGGLLGGLWSVELTKLILGIRQRTGDVYVFPLLLAMIIGRVGCFLMGLQEATYGIPTSSILGINLGDGIPRHATALYEIVFLALLWWTLVQLAARRALRPGRLFMYFMCSYLTYRFCIGFLQPLLPIGGLGTLQWACLIGLLWYVFDYRLSTSN